MCDSYCCPRTAWLPALTHLSRIHECRAAILGAEDDPWWPPEHHSRAAAMLPPGRVEFDAEQVHAFCVDVALSARAAAFLHRAAAPALPRATSRL